MQNWFQKGQISLSVKKWIKLNDFKMLPKVQMNSITDSKDIAQFVIYNLLKSELRFFLNNFFLNLKKKMLAL